MAKTDRKPGSSPHPPPPASNPSTPPPKPGGIQALEDRITALEDLMAEFQPFVGPPLSEKLARYVKV